MRILRSTIIAAAALALTLPAAFAQDQSQARKPAAPAKKAKAAAAMNAMPAAPKPGPEMQKLVKALAGTWNASERFEVNDFMPKGGSATGTETIKAGPGGYSLLIDARVHGSIGNYWGHSISYWDQKQQAYISVWCDSTAPECENGAMGKWEGENLVFTFAGHMGETAFTEKDTFSEIKPDSFTLTIESSMGGGEMKPFVHIQYTRKAATKAAAAPAAQ